MPDGAATTDPTAWFHSALASPLSTAGLAWMSFLWIALAALATWHVARHARTYARRDALALSALSAGALLLRARVATWGPGDLTHGFRDLWKTLPCSFYGDAPFPPLLVLLRLIPGGDRLIIAANLTLGALAPSLLACVMRTAGAGRPTALLAGAALATYPLAVRFSGEAQRPSWVVFLSLCGLWALAHHAASAGLPRAVYLAGYGAAAMLCTQSRPEAGLFLPLALLFSMVTRRSSWRERGALVAAQAVIAGACALYLHFHIAGTPGWRLGHPTGTRFSYAELVRFSILLDPDFTPRPLQLCVLLGAALGLAARDRLVAWAVASVGVLFVGYHLVDSPVQYFRLASARYYSLSFVPISVLGASGIARCAALLARPRPAWQGAVSAALAVVVAAASAPTFLRVVAPRTIDEEYAFLRREVARLPADAVVVYVDPRLRGASLDIGLQIPPFTGAMIGRPGQTWQASSEQPLARRPRFYYRAASCSPSIREYHARGLNRDRMDEILQYRAACAEALSRYGARPVATAEVHASNFALDYYAGARVPIGLYRID